MRDAKEEVDRQKRRGYIAFIDKYIEDCIVRAYNAGYDKGLEDNMDYSDAEQDGMNEAWEIVNELYKMDGDDFRQVFGTCYYEKVFSNHTPQSVISMLEQYKKDKQEERDEIKVGDEVILLDYCSEDDETRGVVTRNDVDYQVLIEDGTVVITHRKDAMKKTGRHFDEVEQILSKMRENA